ncbi:MAG: hypothetical protein WCL11_29595, partial [Verrucomicrobiota bacterium]
TDCAELRRKVDELTLLAKLLKGAVTLVAAQVLTTIFLGLSGFFWAGRMQEKVETSAKQIGINTEYIANTRGQLDMIYRTHTQPTQSK